MKQNKPKVIVITGSIGTGKSAAVSILKELGYTVADSDKIVHEGYNAGNKLHDEVLNCFGRDIINKDGTINRQKLGQIVFSDEISLKKLNEIVHIYVYDELIDSVNKCTDKVIFLDIPLALEERNFIKKLNYDEIWLVYVNSRLQKERLIKRALLENKNPDEVVNIINKQISIEEKKSMADEIINNEGTMADLQREIEKLLCKKGLW